MLWWGTRGEGDLILGGLGGDAGVVGRTSRGVRHLRDLLVLLLLHCSIRGFVDPECPISPLLVWLERGGVFVSRSVGWRATLFCLISSFGNSRASAFRIRFAEMVDRSLSRRTT